MKLLLNTLTIERLKDGLGDKPGCFKLFYDTEDCGCNGVLVILIVDGPNNTDIEIQRDPFVFLCDLQQESLFDDVMRIEAEENYPSFKLSSDSSVFSTNIRLKDIRL